MEMVPAERIQKIQNVMKISAYNALKYEEWSGKIRPFKWVAGWDYCDNSGELTV
jgi:hypothetical protein